MQRKTRIITASLSSAVLMTTPITSAFAEGFSVGVYPTVSELTLQPGDTKELTIRVKNNQDEPVTLTPLLQPFRASREETGQVEYEQAIPPLLKRIQVLDHGQIAQEITLSPQEERPITLRAIIPPDTLPTDTYFSVIFVTKPDTQAPSSQTDKVTAQTTLSQGVASNVLMTIGMQPSESPTLVEFSAPAFVQKSPVSFTLRIHNPSGHYTKLSGSIDMENALGMKVETLLIPETRILGESTRALSNENSYTQSLPRVTEKATLLPGIYRARLALTGPQNPNPIAKTIYFVVAPYQLILVTVIICIGFYFIKNRLRHHRAS